MRDDLETLVRETRPEPRPEFVEHLGARVDAGFAAPTPVTPRGGLLGPLLGVAATFLVALVVVVGVTAGGGVDDEQAASGGAGGGRAASEAADPARAATPSSGVRGGSAPPGRPGGARAVDRRITLALATGADDFTRVSDGVIAVSDGVGGVVQRSTVDERDGQGFASFDLRVPTGRLDAALAELSRLANVRSRTAASEDITGATVSARARLADARDERTAVLRALEDVTGDRADELRVRLRVLRARIAREEARVRALERRADLATVRVTVESTGEAGAWTPGDAARDAGRVLEVVLGVALVALAVLGPFALLAALVVAAARLGRRRRREAVLGA